MSRRVFWTAMAAVFLAGGFVDVPDSSGFWGGGPGHHRGITPIDWRVAGTVVNTQLAIPTNLAPPADPFVFPPGVVIDIVAKGSPGNAQIKVIAIPGGIVSLSDPDCALYPKLAFADDDLVAIFADQSMLFATLDKEKGGYLCLEPPPQRAVANMNIIGGTGRFMDAEGSFTGSFLGYPAGASGALAAETGTIEGWIDR